VGCTGASNVRVVKKFCIAFVALVLASITLCTAQPASAYPVSTLTLNGHGFGHGRGMSQWGSLGYAVDHTWSWQQILDHYYSNTTFGASAGNPTIGVRMLGFDNKDTLLMSANTFTVGAHTIPGGQAARVSRTGANTFAIWQGPNCAGPWTQVGTQSGTVTATPANSNPGNDENQMLRLCLPGAIRGVRGTVASVEANNTIQTVNSLPLEDYLRGVVPRESPASWGDIAGGKGMNALRAQSVAARSYVLASANYSYATTCDTQACQVYGGAFLNGAYIEDPRTDQAIADTAGSVRRMPNSSIARTEFSSSSGGWTAGGTFPAVEDKGDAYSGNTQHHKWTTTINVADIEAKFPTVGVLQNIQVATRNGLGDYGGRITKMIISGTNGAVETTGLDFRSKMGAAVKSDWFEIVGTPSGGVSGYMLLANDGGIFSLGNAPFYGSMGGKPLNAPIRSFAKTPSGNGYWEVASDGGIFAFGDAQFFGSMGGKPLNKPIVGMAPTPSGNGYWLVASDGGIFAFGDAPFFGSMGGKPLNQPIVGMTASPTGQGYWFVASDGGIFSYGDAPFYGSTGSIKLTKPIVGMSSTVSGAGYWLVASDGGIFAYGDAGFHGSLPSSKNSATITGMARTTDGAGYLLVGSAGQVFSYGSAPNFGDLSSKVSNYKGTITAIQPTS
jgi:SpoIID/LytB domain protein